MIGRAGCVFVVLACSLLLVACRESTPPASQPALPAAENIASFDHRAFDRLLKQFVDDRGLVDYAGLKKEQAMLDAYLASIAAADLTRFASDERLAFLINAYNAYTLKLIIQHYPIDSIRSIDDPWKGPKWMVAGEEMTLDEIEHGRIRVWFDEPRIHFALVCAAIGCPILRQGAYTTEKLDEQLADQMRYAHTHDRWFRFDAANDVVYLTKLYDWYGDDFLKHADSVLAYVAHYSPALKQRLERDGRPRIEWIDYDWSLNDQAKRETRDI